MLLSYGDWPYVKFQLKSELEAGRCSVIFVKIAGKEERPDGLLSPDLASSITDNMDRRLDSGFRGGAGAECLRFPFGGEEGLLIGGDVERGGVGDGDGVLAHSADSVVGSQDVILAPAEEGCDSVGSNSEVVLLIMGLVIAEAVVGLVMMDKGARMLNI